MPKRAKIKELVPSIITSEFQINGDFIGEGAAEIDCVLNGDIRCISLVISKNAVVNGNVTAERVEIFGEVNGNIVAKNVICGESAKVVGDIIHQKIQIANGAYVDGSCRKFVVDEKEKKKAS